MLEQNSQTPPAHGSSNPDERIPIVPRRARFTFEDVEERFFFQGNGPMSAVLVALSSVFPPGENEFIQSVRLFTDRLSDKQLLDDVDKFTTQEGRHSALHKALNATFDRLGYGATDATRYVGEELKTWNAGRTSEERLAQTVVLEHITATMAHYALTNPERLAALPASIRELLSWHAIEEIEHKAVAFDVYETTVGDRWLLRRTLLREMILFPLGMGTLAQSMLDAMGYRPTFAEYAEAGRFLFGPGGLIAGVLPQYLALLKPGFHPWDVNDAWLVEEWSARTA